VVANVAHARYLVSKSAFLSSDHSCYGNVMLKETKIEVRLTPGEGADSCRSAGERTLYECAGTDCFDAASRRPRGAAVMAAASNVHKLPHFEEKA
jgi:hypothetical protein